MGHPWSDALGWPSASCTPGVYVWRSPDTNIHVLRRSIPEASNKGGQEAKESKVVAPRPFLQRRADRRPPRCGRPAWRRGVPGWPGHAMGSMGHGGVPATHPTRPPTDRPAIRPSNLRQSGQPPSNPNELQLRNLTECQEMTRTDSLYHRSRTPRRAAVGGSQG